VSKSSSTAMEEAQYLQARAEVSVMEGLPR